jgi:Putative threonine/serine exporter
MIRRAAACGLDTVDVDITFSSIIMCCHRGMMAAPVTSMRLVRYRTTDLTRLALVTRIVDQVVRGGDGCPGCRRCVGRGSRRPPSVPTLGGHRWMGRAGRRGGVAARRAAGDRVDRVRGHGVHRSPRPPARPVGGRAVLPAVGRGLGGHRLHARVVRGRRAAAGDSAVAGHRGQHHGAAVGVVGGGHRAGRDLRLPCHRGGPGGRDRVAVRRAAHRRHPRTEAGPQARDHPRPGRTGGRRRRPVRDLDLRSGHRGWDVRAGLLRATARCPRLG